MAEGPRTVVGIDPGMSGAICILEDGEARFHDMPTFIVGPGNKRDYDVLELGRLIKEISLGQAGKIHFFIEKQQPMPSFKKGQSRDGQSKTAKGSVGQFWTGFGYGVILGCIGTALVPYTCVSPRSWKATMLKDMPKGKESSLAKARQLYPSAANDLKRVKDHNRAEALLVAEHGRRDLTF